MKLSTIDLIGFRNYKKARINLNDKTLIIGSNDIGKTNLLWAIRLLLDRSLSDYDIEPQDSDFYAFEETNKFEIILTFTNVTADCVVSKLKGRISDDDQLIIAYQGFRDGTTHSKSYKLFIGADLKCLEEIEDRYYRSVLNVKYIGSKRDFLHYIKREKNYLFQAAKENRQASEEAADEKLYAEIKGDLQSVDKKIPQLHFISNATNIINDELLKLSLHHGKQKVVFDATSSNVDNFINNVSIASKSNNQSIEIGGDGRLNQIYLALWAFRNELTEESLKEVTIFCIEEPEAHLHPHQQRKLADYLNLHLKGQVIITTHSPQIASEFSPNSIVRLVHRSNSTSAASDGCSKIIKDAFDDFGYRMSIIPAEAFFADVVLLVEGPSEELLYRTAAKQLDIDIDRANISILSAAGVGFRTFVNILNSLEIEWVLRTDRDISKVPRKNEFIYVGIKRCLNIYDHFFEKDDKMDSVLIAHRANIEGLSSNVPSALNEASEKEIKSQLERFGMYVSDKDLEYDLFDSAIQEDLLDFYKLENPEEVVDTMQSSKAIHMYRFLAKRKDCLKKLKDSGLLKPLYKCLNIVERKHK